jgi:hypothetical protein
MNFEGGCACGTVRYKLTASPMIVHACHCRNCQRLTGGPFVINIWIEGAFVEMGTAAPKSCRLVGGSGKPHDVFFCDACGTTLWSRYHIAPGDCLFVRAGTLDNPDAVSPDVHIFTRTKLPWLELPKGVPAFALIYKIDEVVGRKQGAPTPQPRGAGVSGDSADGHSAFGRATIGRPSIVAVRVSEKSDRSGVAAGARGRAA